MARASHVLKSIALGGIRFYQAALRPMNPWGCKYYPSCSNYALEAIERHGPARGAWLGLRRLLRCHPLVFGGFDPVPDPESHPFDRAPFDSAQGLRQGLRRG